MSEVIESPFAARADVATRDTAGAKQTQSRELAETQTKYLMAERFPRDEVAAMDRILNAFSRPTLAEKAAYQFARGGTDITGPSIRAAEAIAQQWGNMDSGWRELQRGTDATGVPYSEVEAFCVDLQARNSKRLQFIVRHWRDTKQGGYKLKDERDIYELCANQAQRRLRACILASVPGDVTEAAMQQAEVTLKSKADTSPEAMAKMVEAFADFGVTREQIEKRIQRRLDAISPAQVVGLKRVYASLRDDMSAPKDWFEVAEGEQIPAGTANALKAAATGKRSKVAAAAASPAAGAAGPVGAAEAEGAGTTTAPAKQNARPAAAAAQRTYAMVADAIQKAKDRDGAALELDTARNLPADQYDDLVTLFNKHWSA
jgi:hypothetical protein